MAGARRSGPDNDMVVAARDGDPRALDALVAQSLPLVYNIVGRALNGHADVDDVVQETLMRVVRHLPDLRDPEAFRSWLVAITVRQVRDREQYRRTVLHRSAELDTAQAVPDPAADFADLTILRLGLTDQRREVAEATRWLDPDDRGLLALWWLEETGDLTRADLAGALGLSAPHAAVRMQRMKEQVQAARAVIRALRARPGCPDLASGVRDWDGTPGALWRKRLARHVRECDTCAGRSAGMLPMDRLLAGVALVPVPALLLVRYGVTQLGVAGQGAAAQGTAAHGTAAQSSGLQGSGGHGSGGPGSSAAQGTGTHTQLIGAPARAHAAHAGRLRSLLSIGSHGPVPVIGAAAACVAVVAFAAVRLNGPAAAPVAAAEPASPSAQVSASASPSAPVPSPSAAAPSPSVATKPSTVRPPAAPPAVSSAKKGVGVWNFSGVSPALAQSKASWYYTWSTTHQGVTTPSGVGFVPMIWGTGSVTATALAQARSAGRYLLGFNEPDRGDQANMSPDQALALWPQLMSTGQTLGSPAVSYGADTPGGWLDTFMTGAAGKGYRVDFITLHWYGSDFTTTNAVN